MLLGEKFEIVLEPVTASVSWISEIPCISGKSIFELYKLTFINSQHKLNILSITFISIKNEVSSNFKMPAKKYYQIQFILIAEGIQRLK